MFKVARTFEDRSPLLGFLLWLLVAARLSSGSNFYQQIELMLWLAILVIVPLGLRLIGGTQLRDRSAMFRLLLRLQPLVAVCAVLSGFFPIGLLAGALALPWAIYAAILALGALLNVRPTDMKTTDVACLVAAQLYLPIGAIALLRSRLGLNPLGFTEPIVVLTAIHFHYTGFAALIFTALAIKIFESLLPRYQNISTTAAWGLIGGVPLMAAGWVLMWPALKLVAVSVLVLSLLTISIMTLAILSEIRSRVAKALLVVAAGSLIGGMCLAASYGLAEFVGVPWITIPTMVRTHGYLNGLGFSLCGLLGWVLEKGQPSHSNSQSSITEGGSNEP